MEIGAITQRGVLEDEEYVCNGDSGFQVSLAKRRGVDGIKQLLQNDEEAVGGTEQQSGA